jgi:hypothetical protein
MIHRSARSSSTIRACRRYGDCFRRSQDKRRVVPPAGLIVGGRFVMRARSKGAEAGGRRGGRLRQQQPERLAPAVAPRPEDQHEVCCPLDAVCSLSASVRHGSKRRQPEPQQAARRGTAAARTNVTQAQLAEMYQPRWTSPLLCRGYAEDAVRRLEPIRRRPLVVPTAGGAAVGNRRRLPF